METDRFLSKSLLSSFFFEDVPVSPLCLLGPDGLPPNHLLFFFVTRPKMARIISTFFRNLSLRRLRRSAPPFFSHFPFFLPRPRYFRDF